jgi:outer membrane lipase/esterase
MALMDSGCGGSPEPDLPTLDQMLVFGDDLTDGGAGANGIFALTLGQSPTSPPYFDGRWTNGLIYSDWLYGFLGIPYDPVKDNLAVAGATTGTLNIITGDGKGMLNQIQAYLASNPTISPTTLVLLFAGPNNFLLPGLDPATVIPQALNDITQAVTLLAGAGAKHIVLVSIPSYGRAPFAQPLGLRDAFDFLTVTFNDGLTALLDGLKQQLPQVSFFLVNAFEVQFGAILMPELFGFTDVDNPCFFDGQICSTPDQFLYWDEMHFSRIFHQFLGGQFANTICAEPVPFTNCQFLEQLDQVGGN